jgi:hypothetical protein
VAEGITAADTYNIVTLLEKQTLLGGWIIVEESLAGGTSLQVNVNGAPISAAIPIADLVAEDVAPIGFTDPGATNSLAIYAQTGASSVDLVTVGTFTGGRIFLILDFFDTTSLLDQDAS